MVKNVRSMLKISYASCPPLSQVISAQFTLEMCAAAENCKEKKLKFPILGVQDHSKSSMLTPLKSSSLILVMLNSVSVPICYCFCVKHGDRGKMTTFNGVPYFNASLRRPP